MICESIDDYWKHASTRQRGANVFCLTPIDAPTLRRRGIVGLSITFFDAGFLFRSL